MNDMYDIVTVVETLTDIPGPKGRDGDAVIISATRPDPWDEGILWFEELFLGDEFDFVLHTAPYDSSLPCSVEIDGEEQSLLNATDNEAQATEDVLIILS